MRMVPDGMEKWGTVAILKESARLLHKHYRLFLPFYLTFYVPLMFTIVFRTVFLPLGLPPLQFTGFFNAHTKKAGADTDGQLDATVASKALSTVVSGMVFVLDTLGIGAFTYVVAFAYSNVDGDMNDRSIVKRVFKLLPHASFRMLVTTFWAGLLFLLVGIFSAIVGGILFAITSAVAGSSDPSCLTLFVLAIFLLCFIFLAFRFYFAHFVAVLEPEKYGREALKRSSKLAKVGGAGTIFAVILLSEIFFVVFVSAPSQAVVQRTLPLWEEILLQIFIETLNSVFKAYSLIVMVVMYFVYKSKFDAVSSSSLTKFQPSSTASAQSPYKSLVPETAYPKSIDEP